MRKDNYTYFLTTNGIPRDNGSRALAKRERLPKFANLQKGLATHIKKGQQYHITLPIEDENLTKTLENIKLAIHSLHHLAIKLKLKSISIAKTTQINHIPWEEILATLTNRGSSFICNWRT